MCGGLRHLRHGPWSELLLRQMFDKAEATLIPMQCARKSNITIIPNKHLAWAPRLDRPKCSCVLAMLQRACCCSRQLGCGLLRILSNSTVAYSLMSTSYSPATLPFIPVCQERRALAVLGVSILKRSTAAWLPLGRSGEPLCSAASAILSFYPFSASAFHLSTLPLSWLSLSTSLYRKYTSLDTRCVFTPIKMSLPA